MIKPVIHKDSCTAYWPLTGSLTDMVAGNNFTSYRCYDGQPGVGEYYADGPLGLGYVPVTLGAYLHVSHAYNFTTSNSWTAECVAKLQYYTFLGGLMSNRGNNHVGGNIGWWTLGYYQGSLYFENYGTLAYLGIDAQDGKWHKYTVTYSTSTLLISIYMDTTLIYQSGVYYPLQGDIETCFQIGNWYNDGGRVAGYAAPWGGTVCHVAIHDRAKTEKEIITEFNKKRVVPCG